MDSDQGWVMPRLTDHQWQQYRAGRDARRAGLPRTTPCNSEWRVWLAGWDSVGINQRTAAAAEDAANGQ